MTNSFELKFNKVVRLMDASDATVLHLARTFCVKNIKDIVQEVGASCHLCGDEIFPAESFGNCVNFKEVDVNNIFPIGFKSTRSDKCVCYGCFLALGFSVKRALDVGDKTVQHMVNKHGVPVY